ncbi:MAG: type II toxin-antitoxin system VapC family toxin [Candidatus Omnitrophota bacterium]
MHFLDTHIVVWLYQKTLGLLSSSALKAIEDNEIFISPIVILELEYLFEIGKLKVDANSIIQYLKITIDLKIDEGSFHEIIDMALGENWTRDPFDRLITAHSKYRDAFLITKDEKISQYYSKTVF